MAWTPAGGEVKREEKSLEQLTDAELIRRSLAEPDCFGLVFSRHWRSLVETASRWHGPFDAEDVIAETFVRAFESRSLFDTHTHFGNAVAPGDRPQCGTQSPSRKHTPDPPWGDGRVVDGRRN